MGDDPSGNLPAERSAEYDSIDLAAFAARAAEHAAATRDVGAVAADAFKGACAVPRDKRNLRVSRGLFKVKQGSTTFELTLLKDRRTPEWIYVVEAAHPYPERALFTITQSGVATPSGWTGVRLLDPQEVLEIVEGVRASAMAAKRHRSLRRWTAVLPRKAWIALGSSGLGLVLSSFLVAGIIVIADSPPYTTLAITDGQVMRADGKKHDVLWSEQYDILSIKTLRTDKNSRIPATGPRQIKPGNAEIWETCKDITRDIREGDAFRVVYRGERGDKFTISIDSKSNKVRICRQKGEGGQTDDAVILQRIEE